MKSKALFLDRDGVILEMVYDLKSGYIHTAINPKEVILVHGIVSLLKKAKDLGYKLIVISNQPNIGLKRESLENFRKTTEKLKELLLKDNTTLDGQYYCLHHPFAKIKKYRENCNCRKPKLGMLMQAARDFDIDLSLSFMIGDGINDVIAGHKAGCKTILIINTLESANVSLAQEKLKNIRADYMVKNVLEVQDLLKK